MTHQRIGFVGLGAMGLPMAANLVAGGFDVRGYDTRPAATGGLAELRGASAGSVGEAAEDADALILMVVNDAQARDVLFAPGVLAGLKPGAIVLLMATCLPPAASEIGQAVEKAGIRFLDAPVSGGVVGAKAGTLSIMAAGARATFESAKPILECLGDKIFYVGDRPGQGALMKAVNQLLCGVHLAVAAEALSLSEKAGIAPATALDIVSGSAASSWMLRDRGCRMLEERPAVTSTVDIFVKDLGIVLSAGAATKAALPLAAVAHQMFLAVSGQGKGAEDDSKVIEAYRRLRGA